jgi:predicted MFS family arabinose efflux permease
MTAAVIDAVPANRLGRATGWLSFAMQTGFLAGPAIAGLATRVLSLPADMLATTLLFLPAVAATPLVADGRKHRPQSVARTFVEVWRSRGFPAVMVGVVGLTVVWGTFQGYLPLFAKEQLLLPGAQIGLMLAIVAGVNGLSRIAGGRIADSVRPRGPLVAACTVLVAAFLLVLPHLSGFWAPTLAAALAVPFLATGFVALGASFAELAPEHARGLASGAYSTFLYGGLGFGPLLFGPVMQAAGYSIGFATCAVTAVAATATMLVLRSEPGRARRRSAAQLPGT